MVVEEVSREVTQIKQRWPLACFSILVILMLDQITKAWIHNNYPHGFILPICPFFNIVHAHNHGVSFGMLQSHTALKQWLLITLALLISAWIVRMLWQTKLKGEFFGFIMILAGAMGNIIDRLRFGYVIDFIELYINEKLRWPAFNVADSSIVLGVGLVLMVQFFDHSKKTN